MELRTKYQYTYFIYPYLIDEKKYNNYIYQLLKNKKCQLKWFNRKKNVEIDSYFLPEIKENIFWTINSCNDSIKEYEKLDTRMQANILTKKKCNIFEYKLEKDIPGKIIEKDGIFFDITKVEIICFNTGICFLLFKTVLNDVNNFSDVLNFNYKFKNINSKIEKNIEYDNIKIQTSKLNNMQYFSELIKEIAGKNILANKINLDTEQLITYSYVCLEQSSWNEDTNLKLIEKEFEKYRKVKPADEPMNDAILKEQSIYKEKYLYYGISSNSSVLLTCDNNIKNYTTLMFKYENELLYHYIISLHKKIYLKKLNFVFSKTKKFKNIKTKFLEFAKKDWIFEITNDDFGKIIEKLYMQDQNIDGIFLKIKQQYDLYYKENEITKNKKYKKWVMIIIISILILNIVTIIISIKNKSAF